jgi:hypothetical protein
MSEPSVKESAEAVIARVRAQDLESLKEATVNRLIATNQGIVRWCDRVRDPEAPFRFRWAVEALRDADVASGNYILGALDGAGLLDRVLTEEQKRDGEAWIKSLEVAENSYEDPALLAYKPPIWDDEAEPWPPTGAHKEALNQYSRGCLRYYTTDPVDQLAGPPPPDWPQMHEADRVLDWIKSIEPNWSWIGRMIRRLMDWHIAGNIPIDPLIDCVKYAYARQDPETGFWANGIQTSFKILITVFEPMNLPVNHADKLIDSVLARMYQPDYDNNLFPCEEFDAFYDIAVAWDHSKGHREEEVLKWAAHRVSYILDTHTQSDEGIASYPDRCIPTWLKFDMAPALPQGDAFGFAIYGAGFNIWIDMLGIADRTGWKPKWRYGHTLDDGPYLELGEKVKSLL